MGGQATIHHTAVANCLSSPSKRSVRSPDFPQSPPPLSLHGHMDLLPHFYSSAPPPLHCQTLAQGDPVCMNQPGHDLAFCLEHDKNPIMGVPRDSYYSHPLQYWLDAFPAEQIHVVQYENLVAVGERQAAELRRLKAFLEIDMDAISDELVSEFNCRSCTIEPEGHMLPEALYQSLVQEARRDTKRLAYLLEKHGLVDSSKAWIQNWGNLYALCPACTPLLLPPYSSLSLPLTPPSLVAPSTGGTRTFDRAAMAYAR